MSKSGLFGLFGGKEQLQLAVIEAGVEHFTREVWVPVNEVEAGLPRLLALCESWLAFFEHEKLPGGCFMTQVVTEFDARPGAVRRAAAQAMGRWVGQLEREAAIAVERGDLPPQTVPLDVAYQLNAFASAASSGYQLFGDRRVFDCARRSMTAALRPA